MERDVPVDAAAKRGRLRRGRVLIALLVLLGVAGGLAWISRVPIATRLIDRELARRGVPARYAIADLGFGRQRLTNVVLGDPADPDLVADWIETATDIGPRGPELAGVRAGHVRLRARLVDGRVSLGAIDRLLPPPSGKPFVLPKLFAEVADARVRLETPYGLVGARLSGRGRLDDGWRGTLDAVAPRLAIAGCTLRGGAASVMLRVRRAAPDVAGPVRLDAIGCDAARAGATRVEVDAALSPALDRWRGTAGVALADAVAEPVRMRRIAGMIGFAGDAARTGGRLDLAGTDVALPRASAARLAVAGPWRIAGGRAILAGRVAARQVAAAAALRPAIVGLGGAAAGSPVAPLAQRLARGIAAVAGDASIDANVAIATGTTVLATVSRASLSSHSGARAAFDGGELLIGHPAGLRLDGRLRMAGGGLPEGAVMLRQSRPGAAIDGMATVAPYTAGTARLALTPVRFTAVPGGATRITGTATLDGPLADGRLEGLTLPLDLRWDGAGALAANPACTPVSFRRLAAAGLVLRPAALTLCPTGAALVSVAGGGIDGGARVSAPRLSGTLGATPVALAARGAEVRLASGGIVVDGLAARLGAPGRVTRLDIATLRGAVAGGALAGTFAGAEGQIANVPLLLERAKGEWRLAGGVLALTGALGVRDAAAAPRFHALSARGVALRLAGGRIDATGELVEPTRDVKVADVAIDHRLGSGSGSAILRVPGITFGDGFQPDLLTPATFGVIADVRGTVRGEGRIAWDADGVTSTGTFATDGTDLAAAFGPVTGIRGSIAFTDLLALESAPGQVATIASINPGVAVNDGRVTYRTLAGSRVAVSGGTWPFAGGTMTLEPTLLDFSSPQVRRMTFRVEAMDAGKFLQQFDFQNVNATGTFDGVLPMLFDDGGGRIEGGRIAARAGGGSIAYVGELSQKQLGFWGDYAFRALRSLTYRDLHITMNGPLAGEMVTEVRFAGVQQGKGTYSNFILRRLARLPIQFNVRIKAPFRGLIDSAASFYDPKRLVQRNLQQLIEEQNRRTTRPIQPPASENVP